MRDYLIPHNILGEYLQGTDFEQIEKLRSQANLRLQGKHWSKCRRLLDDFFLPFQGQGKKCFDYDCAGPIVSVGREGDLNDAQRKLLPELLAGLIPWRKGPFSYFGSPIEAEWRSERKWKRILPHLDSPGGKRIADVGCNNGYYMLRASSYQPELVVGFEPQERCWYQFELFRRALDLPHLVFELFTSEQLCFFPGFFDIVLCLGVIYHCENPLGLLFEIHNSMKPGSQLILECQAIPGDQPTALFPPRRYAKARNVYFLPTASCLQAWLKRVGFVDVSIFSTVKVTTEEQRKTPLAPYESLNDFLDPSDPTKTIEGFPAPLRVCVKARRKG